MIKLFTHCNTFNTCPRFITDSTYFWVRYDLANQTWIVSPKQLGCLGVDFLLLLLQISPLSIRGYLLTIIVWIIHALTYRWSLLLLNWINSLIVISLLRRTISTWNRVCWTNILVGALIILGLVKGHRQWIVCLLHLLYCIDCIILTLILI